MRRAGSGAWAGLCNTHFWIDRTTGIAASIYSNFLPFVPPGGPAAVRRLRTGALRRPLTEPAGRPPPGDLPRARRRPAR